VRVLREVPVVGAALIALDLAGGSVAAKSRLREAFAGVPNDINGPPVPT